MKKRRTGRLPLLLLAGVSILTIAIGILAFGPTRAIRITVAAMTNVMIDGMVEAAPRHRIPVVEVWIDQRALDSLERDLPWSGDDQKSAELRENGVRYPATFRYRGQFIGTHYLGGKKSFRLGLKRNNPFAPYRRINFIDPKAIDMLNQHMAFWIASRMGVVVPWSEMVFVRMNGVDHGVHHAFEQIDGDIERNRHLVDHAVPVFKGDYPPATGRTKPEGVYLWEDAKHWQYASKADSAEAKAMLVRLVSIVNDSTVNEDARLDSLDRLIDIDAYVRFHAALKVLHSTHEDNVHNQWLVLSPRSGKFYPVLWDPILLFSRVDPFYPIHDAIEFHLMRHAHLRLLRDQHIHDALKELEADSLFDGKLDQEIGRIRPSVLADRNKHGEITDHAEDVLRFSALHWARACDKLRDGMHAYWKKLEDRMRIDSLLVQREGDVLIARWSGDGTLGYRIGNDSTSSSPVGMNAGLLMLADANGKMSLEIAPSYPVTHSMGAKPRALKDGEYWIAPHELRIQLNGADPDGIIFINLITGETVEARH